MSKPEAAPAPEKTKAESLLGPLLKIAATSMAAQGLRRAADDAARFMVMSLLGVIAASVAMICLSGAAFALLRDHLGTAEAWGIRGAFYALVAIATFLARHRHR